MPLLVKSFYDQFRIDSAESTHMSGYAFLAQWFKVSAKQIQDEWLQVSVVKALSGSVSTESILFSQLTVPRMLNPDPDERLASALELKPFLNLLKF